MAGLKKFLYLDPTDLVPHEQATDDELNLGALTMSGDIAMGGNEVTGLPSTPSAGDAAASKTYVDNQVSGLQWRAPVDVFNLIGNLGELALEALSPNNGDAYVVSAVDGDGTLNPGGVSIAVGDIVEYNGSSSQWVKLISGSGGFVPVGTRAILDGTGTETLISPYTNGSDNDKIVEFDGTSLTGADTGDATDGSAVLVQDPGHVSVYDNLGYVYEGTVPSGSWIQFTGAGQIVAGDGLSKTGNQLDVNAGDGISIVTDRVTIDLAASSGLELTGTTPNAELRVDVDGAHGIVIGASGLELEIDDTPDTLDVDGDGLKVVGLPSLFKVNDVAVGSTVTAAALDDLTDGSNADSLHTHSFASAEEAQRIEHTHLNNTTVTTGRVVRWSGTNNEVTHADNATSKATAQAIGVARTGGAANPGTSEVVKHGVCASVLTSATVNTPYYLGASGALVLGAAIPKPGYVVRMGFAVNGTDLDVQIQNFGRVLA